jgi:hypothetical protein
MIPLLAIVFVIGAVAASARSTPAASGGGTTLGRKCGPGTATDPSSYDLNAWAKDLAEVQDPAVYAEIADLLQKAGSTKASAAGDIATLQQLATTLDDKGYHDAAKRCRIRAADIAAYYCL